MRRFKAWLCLICALLLLSSACIPAGALELLRGDADGDGEVSSVDVTVIQRVLAGIYPDSDGMIAKRSAVIDGTLSLPDATVIQRYLAQLYDPFRIGESFSASETQPYTPVFPTQENQLPIIKV